MFYYGGQFIPCCFQLISGLHVHPEFRRCPEKTSQPESDVRRNGASSIDDLAHARRRNTQGERQFINAHTGGLIKSSRNTSPGCTGAILFGIRPRLLVVVDNFNVIGRPLVPCEANPPLIVDADAVLTLPAAA